MNIPLYIRRRFASRHICVNGRTQEISPSIRDIRESFGLKGFRMEMCMLFVLGVRV